MFFRKIKMWKSVLQITNYLFIQVNYKNNWFVQESSRVSVHLAKESDVSLTAVTNQKETHGSTPWEQVEDLTKNENTSSEEHPELNNQEHWYKNSIKTGNGTYKLNIEKAYNLNMSVLEK
ncbi:hypothetical protein BC_1727 [Bacillus cereus ATCC 14579]|uniref:Uncharacterized protein n=1 Tax=Bacillus cereus (strain ATCC 14579 / DSM 31 / CCUG 7414 / JCM 2152 / NBRC 15305 / NCIMB 9373 / NCTC 2599 / NRRL B-3711) TaxID=226900 RepID=Q81F72_BACCR|nr:hypothetical protein BC_1727 [Bacillus cereus ATCC 14579]